MPTQNQIEKANAAPLSGITVIIIIIILQHLRDVESFGYYYFFYCYYYSSLKRAGKMTNPFPNIVTVDNGKTVLGIRR